MDQHRNPNHRSIHRSRHLHRRHLNGCEARYSDILLHPLSFHLRRIIQHRNQKFHCTLVTTLDTSNHHHHCKSYNLLQFHLPNNQFHCHKRQLQKLYLYHIHKLYQDHNLSQLCHRTHHHRHRKYKHQSSQSIHLRHLGRQLHLFGISQHCISRMSLHYSNPHHINKHKNHKNYYHGLSMKAQSILLQCH